MEQKLTQTQLFMIEQINKAIEEVKEKIKKANDAEKPKLRIRLKQLEEQLENASKPFERTEKEKELINKMAENVKENAEVITGDKIEGDRSDKKLTSREELRYKLTSFLNDTKNKIVELKKVLAVQQEVLDVLSKHEAVSEEKLFEQNVKQIKDNIVMLKVSLRSMEDRVNNAGIIDEIDNNYEFLKRVNIFLGNVLGLSDYQEYAENLKKEVEEENK